MQFRGGVYHRDVTSDTLKRFHGRMLGLWAGPGLCISVILALFAGVKVVLIWNLAISVYTVCTEHFIGWRQEDGK